MSLQAYRKVRMRRRRTMPRPEFTNPPFDLPGDSLIPPPPADVSHIKNKQLDLKYTEQGETQKLDLYFPDEYTGRLPLVIYIHGGGFMICDKRDIQLLPFLEVLKHGYALAAVGYRLSGEALFPAAVHDCKCAVRWLRAHADEYDLDPERFAAVGGSAGGNLSAMLAASAGVPELEDPSQGCGNYSASVQAAVDWFGPTDFTKMDAQLVELGLGPCTHNNPDSPESIYMGGTITELDREYVNKANPMTYIKEDLPPIFIQHGSADNFVPILQSKALVKEIERKLGPDRVRFEVIEGAVHADPAFETAENMAKVIAFLDTHLK